MTLRHLPSVLHQIKLDAWEIEECRICAAQRDSNRKSSTDYSSDKTNDKAIWSFIGVLGELALLKYFGLRPDWRYMSTDEGFGGVDVGEIWEVRATQKANNRVFLWSDEKQNSQKLSCAWSKVIVDIDTGVCILAGWAMGYEIAEHGSYRGSIECKRSSWLLDNTKLHPHLDPTTDNDTAIYLHYQYFNLASRQ